MVRPFGGHVAAGLFSLRVKEGPLRSQRCATTVAVTSTTRQRLLDLAENVPPALAPGSVRFVALDRARGRRIVASRTLAVGASPSAPFREPNFRPPRRHRPWVSSAPGQRAPMASARGRDGREAMLPTSPGKNAGRLSRERGRRAEKALPPAAREGLARGCVIEAPTRRGSHGGPALPALPPRTRRPSPGAPRPPRGRVRKRATLTVDLDAGAVGICPSTAGAGKPGPARGRGQGGFLGQAYGRRSVVLPRCPRAPRCRPGPKSPR